MIFMMSGKSLTSLFTGNSNQFLIDFNSMPTQKGKNVLF